MCILAFITLIPFAKGDLLSDGRNAFLNFDFETANDLFEKYSKSLKKSPNLNSDALLDQYMRQLEIAENALENVQKIEIIERLDVPADNFFKFISLPQNGGKILAPDISLLKKRHNQSDFAFSSEDGDLMIWSEFDGNQKEMLMQSERLMDGSWEKPTFLDSILNDGGNARNPFMLTDGLTLYFSSDGESSMGGYDLFVATKDPLTGEYRQPMGLGYPFNSPYNDFLMAIDESNGIGWWVTDRNNIDGQVSVYVFKTNDVRKNYVADEVDDIIALAKVEDITITQNPDTDYKALAKNIEARSKAVKSNSEASVNFIFPMPDGKVARNLSDFSSNTARRYMQQYLDALKEHEDLVKKLHTLRIKYHNTDKSKSSSQAYKNEILELETKRDWQADRLKKMRNSVISAEQKH